MKRRPVTRNLQSSLASQGIYVPKYTPPDAGTMLRTVEADRKLLPRAEIAQVDEPFPTQPAAATRWTLVQAEHAIWTSDKPWSAVDVYLNAPACSMHVVVRIYAIVGHTRVLAASGRTDLTNYNNIANSEYMASATANAERWEVTTQIWLPILALGQVFDRFRYSIVAWGDEPGGDRGSLGGTAIQVPTTNDEMTDPQYSLSQAFIAPDRVRLIHFEVYNDGADTFMQLQNSGDASTQTNDIPWTFFIPQNGTVSFAPPPGIREWVFQNGLCWRANTQPLGTDPTHDAGALLYPTFCVR